MVQVRGDRDDGFIKAVGTALAGQFDHYICQIHSVYPGEPKDRAPALVKAALLEAGVGEERITLMSDLSEAVDTLLRMGSEGDLLVFAPGTGQPKSEVWSQILAFEFEDNAGGLDDASNGHAECFSCARFEVRRRSRAELHEERLQLGLESGDG